MTIVNIISAIGNTKSIYPLLVRDCGIENPVKIAAAYNEHKNNNEIALNATKEKFIDEYSISAVWLGAIPLIDRLGRAAIKKVKNLNADINYKLIAEEEVYEKKYSKFLRQKKDGIPTKKPKELVQGLEYNIQKFNFVDGAEDAVKDLIRVKKNKSLYKALMNAKFLASVVIPISLMGFVLPKLSQNLAAKKRMEEYRSQNNITPNSQCGSTKTFDNYIKGNQNLTSFQGGLTSFLTGLTTMQRMAVNDGVYATGKMASARKDKNEALKLGLEMTGLMFLNYLAPQWIEKGFNLLTEVSLDPKVITDKRFLASIKHNHLVLPKTDSAKDLINFIDRNPQSEFAVAAKKTGKVKFLKNANIRDPRAYVDTEELAKLKKHMEKFAQNAKASGNVSKYAKKALGLKSLTIVGNLMLSSLLLAYCLPKITDNIKKDTLNTEQNNKIEQ